MHIDSYLLHGRYLASTMMAVLPRSDKPLLLIVVVVVVVVVAAAVLIIKEGVITPPSLR